MSVVQKPTKDKLRRWREDPEFFIKDQFGVDLDPWQKQAAAIFPKSQRLAMKACKGPGKTAIMAMLAWNFLATRPHAKVVATSITADNLSDGLWSEMALWQNKSNFLKIAFEWQKTRIISRDHSSTWFMSARTWPKGGTADQQADTLAGLHADYILFVLDEVGGIPDAVMAAAEAALATGKETKLLMAGNPTHLEGPLYRACTSENHLWDVIEITGDPDDPNRSPRIDVQWARDQIAKYGKDNPWVLVNVFGRFPPGSLNTLLGPDDVEKAIKRRMGKADFEFAQKRLGIDVARFGDDRTVIFPRQGLMAFKPVEMRNARSNEIAARVALAKSKWGAEVEFVDGTGGWGSGVVDNLMQMGYTPQEINFASKASDERYRNMRAEMWFRMAEWVKRGGALPNIPELKSELTSVEYMFSNGKFQIEPKDQIKERLGRSPDLADGLALTFAWPELTGDHPDPLRRAVDNIRGQKCKTDYDPFAY